MLDCVRDALPELARRRWAPHVGSRPQPRGRLNRFAQAALLDVYGGAKRVRSVASQSGGKAASSLLLARRSTVGMMMSTCGGDSAHEGTVFDRCLQNGRGAHTKIANGERL